MINNKSKVQLLPSRNTFLGHMMNFEKNILIVDDEVDIAEILQNVCVRSGYTTKMAFTGFEALQVMEGFKPKVIFLNLIMEKMDGMELIRALCNKKFEGHVVISSGYHSSIVEMALDFCEVSSIRSAQILEKPFSLKDIHHCLDNISNFKTQTENSDNFVCGAP